MHIEDEPDKLSIINLHAEVDKQERRRAWKQQDGGEKDWFNPSICCPSPLIINMKSVTNKYLIRSICWLNKWFDQHMSRENIKGKGFVHYQIYKIYLILYLESSYKNIWCSMYNSVRSIMIPKNLIYSILCHTIIKPRTFLNLW